MPPNASSGCPTPGLPIASFTSYKGVPTGSEIRAALMRWELSSLASVDEVVVRRFGEARPER